MGNLKVSNVSKSYQGSLIIEDVSLEVNKGELVSLLGVSGVGKTTLFNIIAGLDLPDCGQVFLDNKDVTGQPGDISYMLQKDLLMPYRTLEDNVSLPLLIKGSNKKEARAKVQSFLIEFGLEGMQKKYPQQLSGGMRQRGALLRTYLFSNKFALLDEPFSALDALTKNSMHQWYLNIMEQIQLSTMFITHDIDEAILLSDRIYLLAGKPGKIVDEIVVEQKRPRTNEFILSDEFRNYKKRILASLDIYT